MHQEYLEKEKKNWILLTDALQAFVQEILVDNSMGKKKKRKKKIDFLIIFIIIIFFIKLYQNFNKITN